MSEGLRETAIAIGRKAIAMLRAELNRDPFVQAALNGLIDALSAQPAPQPSADIERLRDALEPFAAYGGELPPSTHGKHQIVGWNGKVVTVDDFRRAHEVRSAISSQTSPQGKQGVRTELARLGSQEATPNTGVKLEGGGG